MPYIITAVVFCAIGFVAGLLVMYKHKSRAEKVVEVAKEVKAAVKK